MPKKGQRIFLTDEDEHPVEDRAIATRGNRKRWPPAQRCEAMNSPRWKSINGGGRCKRFAQRGGRYCDLHHPDRAIYKAVMKDEVAKMTDARELIMEARRFVSTGQVELMTAAPIAVATIVEIAQNPDISPAVRVKAADLIIRHSGASLERPTESSVNVTINTNAEASRVITERLDRLNAALATPQMSVVQGELSA